MPTYPSIFGVARSVTLGVTLSVAIVLALPLPAIAQDAARLPALTLVSSLSSDADAAITTQRPIVPRDAAEIEIALGRLRLVPYRFRITRKQETFVDDNVLGSRAMQVSTENGRPTLRVSYRDSSERWSLQFDATVGAQWSRETTDAGRPVRVEYSQKPHKPIVITVSGLTPQPAQLSGATLWHLTERHAPEFVNCVLPALARLNADWNLPETLAKAKLFRDQAAFEDFRIDQTALMRDVVELDSPERSVRAAAAARLRSAGLAVHMPLGQLSNTQLTPQQRQTVEQLLTVLEPPTADTPTRLAYWLSGDPTWR